MWSNFGNYCHARSPRQLKKKILHNEELVTVNVILKESFDSELQE